MRPYGQGAVPKWLRERSAKPLCNGSSPFGASTQSIERRQFTVSPLLRPYIETGNSWEPQAIQGANRLPVLAVDYVRVAVECGLDGSVTQLLLGDLCRHAQLVQL